MNRGVGLALSVIGAAAAAAGALALRYVVVEPAEMGQACLAALGPWWCPWRDALVRSFRAEAFGWGALVAGTLALVVPSRAWGVMAVIAGVFGLALYNAGLASVALAIGLTRVVRP
jgi:hypothetical protein